MLQTRNHAGAISLRNTLPESRMFGAQDFEFTSCSFRAADCRSGDLFVALVGVESDGHNEVFDAVERGAGAILSERPLPVRVPVCVVDDTHTAMGHVCHELLGNPGRNMQLVGVTGTSGKTTTSVLIRSILQQAGQRVGMTSSLGHSDGFNMKPAVEATPRPPELADCLARMAANGCSHAVLELSSNALAQRGLAGLELNTAVLTNIKRDHLDRHGSLRNYRRVKGRIFDHLLADGPAIVNVDDPASEFALSELDHPVLTIGMRNPADLEASIIEQFCGEQTILLTAGSECIPVRTRMIGKHHAYNCLAAAAVGLVMGIDLTTIVKGLEAVEQVPGRLENLQCGQPYGVFVDYAHTPDTLSVALRTLKDVTEGRLICVFGADGDCQPETRAQLGRIVERRADLGIITNDNPRYEEPLEIAHDILDGYERPSRAHVLPDRGKAIEWALEQAKPGDTVLIAGKGDQNHQIVGGQRYHFDDRELAKNWLYEVGAHIEYESPTTTRPHLKIFRHVA